MFLFFIFREERWVRYVKRHQIFLLFFSLLLSENEKVSTVSIDQASVSSVLEHQLDLGGQGRMVGVRSPGVVPTAFMCVLVNPGSRPKGFLTSGTIIILILAVLF